MKASAIYNELRRMFPVNWEMSRAYRLPTGNVSQPYYIAWSAAPRPRGEGWSHAFFDENGVLITNGFHNPVSISQFALYHYARGVAGDGISRARFIAQADHLVRAQRSDGAYPYPKPLPAYGAPSGWLSGMAQGEVASVLLRAFALTGAQHYRNYALAALQPLCVDVSEGGASYLRNGNVFFEEVATLNPCHILNGHLYAAFAMWEFSHFGIGGDAIRALHHDAVHTLERWIPQYDALGWSYYDLAVDGAGRRHQAPLWYHQFHIAQLRVYAAMTGRELFAKIADRWQGALDRRDVRARVWRYAAESLVNGLRRRATRAPVTAFSPLPIEP